MKQQFLAAHPTTKPNRKTVLDHLQQYSYSEFQSQGFRGEIEILHRVIDVLSDQGTESIYGLPKPKSWLDSIWFRLFPKVIE